MHKEITIYRKCENKIIESCESCKHSKVEDVFAMTEHHGNTRFYSVNCTLKKNKEVVSEEDPISTATNIPKWCPLPKAKEKEFDVSNIDLEKI